MPSLREDQQPDAVIDLRHGALHRAPTDEPTDAVVLDAAAPEPAGPNVPPDLPTPPVFTHDPVELDGSGPTRGKRRVAELEAIAVGNALAAREARRIALEQHEQREAALAAWKATTAELVTLRRELQRFTAARDDLIARERARAEEAARADAAAELQFADQEYERLQAEVTRLGAALGDQQTLDAERARHLHEVQREREDAQSEARRAVAAFETAERRLATASETVRSGAVELARAVSERDAAVAELDELAGGHGRVAQLSERVEDLVQQLAELDDELVAVRDRARAAESEAAAARAEAGRVRGELGTHLEARDTELRRTKGMLDAANGAVAELEAELGERQERAAAEQKVSIELAEAERQEAAVVRAERDAELARASQLEEALVAARAEAEALQRETMALAEQLEEAWDRAEEARRIVATAEPPVDAPSETPSPETPSPGAPDGDATMLAALTELAAPPPDPGDPGDPDARRAALGYLSALADLPPGATPV